VVSEDAVVLDLDNVVLVLRVLLLQMLKDSELNTCLVLVPLLVLDDFDGDDLTRLMVTALYRLTKTTLA